MKEIFRRRPKYLSVPTRTNDASQKVPDNMWISCPRCHELLYTKEYEDNFKVCSKCRYHARLSPHERLATLLDDGSFEELDAGLCSADPLRFSVGDQSYVDKLEECARGGVEGAAAVKLECLASERGVVTARSVPSERFFTNGCVFVASGVEQQRTKTGRCVVNPGGVEKEGLMTRGRV